MPISFKHHQNPQQTSTLRQKVLPARMHYYGHLSLDELGIPHFKLYDPNGQHEDWGDLLPNNNGLHIGRWTIEGQEKTALVVWLCEEGLSFKPREGRHMPEVEIVSMENGQNTALIFQVDDTQLTILPLWAGKPDKCPPYAECVWPSQTLRFRKKDGSYFYPRAPVRPWAWELVAGLGSPPNAQSNSNLSWSISFQGNITREWVLTDVDTNFHTLDSSLWLPNSSNPIHLAVWPPTLIHSWSIYRVLFGDGDPDQMSRIDELLRPQVWVGEVDELPGRKYFTSESGLKRTSGLYAIEPSTEQQDSTINGPLYLSLEYTEEADAAGVFSLLADQTALPQAQTNQACNMALDFGTSNTVIAVRMMDGQNPVPLDLSGKIQSTVRDSNEMDLTCPLVHVGSEDDNTLVTQNLWLPTLPSKVFGETRGSFTQIPSLLFSRLVAGESTDSEALSPFAEITFPGPGFEIKPVLGIEQMASWDDQLKWGSNNTNTQHFIALVLAWAALVVRHRTQNVTLYASYPLAFDNDKIEDFGKILKGAYTQAKLWTGCAFTLNSNPPTPQHEGAWPSTDESSALLHGAFTSFKATNRRDNFARLVFAADLGGGTLDVMLAAIQDDETKRIVASESVKIGANKIIHALMNHTKPPQLRDKSIHKALMMRHIRSNQLTRSMRGAFMSNSEPGRLHLEWESNENSEIIKAIGDIYTVLLIEYCARFVAGSLIDTTSLVWHLENHGGGFAPEFINAVKKRKFALLTRLSGNGWRFLDPEEKITGWSLSRMLEALEERTAALATESEFEVNWSWDERRSSQLQTGEETALGVLAIGANEGVTNRGCAPNGWDDGHIEHDANNNNEQNKKQLVPWWYQVGPSSRISTVRNSKLNPHERWYREESLQMTALSKPALPNFSKACATGYGQKRGKSRWDHASPQRPSDSDLERIQDHQGQYGRGEQFRAISTSRAFFESVAREFVHPTPEHELDDE